MKKKAKILMMTKDFGFLIIFDMFSYKDGRRNFPSHQGKAAVLCSPTVPTGVFRSFGWVSLTRMTAHGCEVCMCSKQFYICFVRSICMLFL